MVAARAEPNRPSLLVVTTHIGYGSPNKQDSEKSHGEPLGAAEVLLTKEALRWPQSPTFLVPDAAGRAFAPAAERGAEESQQWTDSLTDYRREFPELGAELDRRLGGVLPPGWDSELPTFAVGDKVATRAASGKVLNAIASVVPEVVGGSADLAGSNKTTLGDTPFYSPAVREGRNLHFGVREHAMGSALNGMALSGMLRPYGGTFLIFSDYMRPAIRLAALMGQPVTYVFTHDSIFLGEDGPTHQPVSQLLSLRSIPNLVVLRPCDANETRESWRLAMTRNDGPTALCLTRQGLATLAETEALAGDGVARGGYVLASNKDGQDPDIVLIGTGSEVHLALGAHRQLSQEGVASRVVSLPSWELFDAQPSAYRDQVLPPTATRRLAVEAGLPLGWERYVGPKGAIIGQEGYGASAPAGDLAKHFGFTVDHVLDRARKLLKG
jgi:transketolase